MSASAESCFNRYTTGDSHAGVTVQCAADETGTIMATCSGYTRADPFGDACNAYCNRNTQQKSLCAAEAAKYCAAYDGQEDCRCVAPNGTSFLIGATRTRVTFASVGSFVQQNGFTWDPRCAYPGCGIAATQSAIIPAWTQLDACPAQSGCVVDGVDVTLTDIQAGSISIISQTCGKGSGTGGNAGQAGSGGAGTPSNAKQFSSTDVAFVALVVVAIVVTAVVFFVSRSRANAAAAQLGQVPVAPVVVSPTMQTL